MAATTQQLIALANDASFRQRINALAIQVAGEVYSEASNTDSHPIRAAFARNVLNGAGQNIASVIVYRTNLSASTVTYNFSNGHIETDATDAAISSQIMTDWNMLAGV